MVKGVKRSRLSDVYRRDPDIFCHDLPTEPLSSVGKVLVTGASGYIGGRLVPELVARGYDVRAMVRADMFGQEKHFPGAEVFVADALDPDALNRALDGVDTAYYLIHSLLLGSAEFAEADLEAARNFRRVAEEKGVKRLIYLGGLGDITAELSKHLRSRIQVEEELRRGKTPVTSLRAAIIIGSGSASYEIIQHLVRRLWIVPYPHWARNKCQPVAVRDVIKCLVGVLEKPESSGESYDIGGADVLRYVDMLKTLAELLNKRRVFFRVFPANVELFSYIASLLTPVPAPITAALMEGLKNEVICRCEAIRALLPYEPLTYRQSVVRALSREEQDEVYTRWSDAYPPAHELAIKLDELKETISYTAVFSLETDKDASALFKSICSIGGRKGWFSNNWMWRLRGIVDRVFLGPGTSRGRKSYTTLAANDVIDFWRVEEVKPDRRLLLRAEMKLPGKAWLEFEITEENGRRNLFIRPFFHTNTIAGRIYWYIFVPFHGIVFRDLIKQIEKRS